MNKTTAYFVIENLQEKCEKSQIFLDGTVCAHCIPIRLILNPENDCE